MDWLASAHAIVGLLAGGFALIFYATDRSSRTTRAMSLSLLAMAAGVISGSQREAPAASLSLALFGSGMETLSILAGVEWGRRIGETAARGRLQTATNVLFRFSQVLVLVYAGLLTGYIVLFPELALAPVAGFIAVRGVEFAVFAPVLGSGMLLAAIALLILLLIRIDSAEKIRLRALLLSAPFLLSGLMVSELLVPMVLTVGLLIFLAGSVRYLQVMNQRGLFMRQFLSPEVARVVQQGGIEEALKRERRPLSVVACDLRGFTAYARERDSDAVATLLERYYEVVGAVAAEQGGTVKDHAGDGVLILVGAPLPLKDHAERAAKLALELRERVRALLTEAGGELGIGIGVASGRITVGAIRGAGRLEYVAVGNAVNLAARLCSRAENGEILLDSRIRAALDGHKSLSLDERAPETPKGFAEPVAVFALG